MHISIQNPTSDTVFVLRIEIHCNKFQDIYIAAQSRSWLAGHIRNQIVLDVSFIWTVICTWRIVFVIFGEIRLRRLIEWNRLGKDCKYCDSEVRIVYHKAVSNFVASTTKTYKWAVLVWVEGSGPELSQSISLNNFYVLRTNNLAKIQSM